MRRSSRPSACPSRPGGRIRPIATRRSRSWAPPGLRPSSTANGSRKRAAVAGHFRSPPSGNGRRAAVWSRRPRPGESAYRRTRCRQGNSTAPGASEGARRTDMGSWTWARSSTNGVSIRTSPEAATSPRPRSGTPLEGRRVSCGGSWRHHVPLVASFRAQHAAAVVSVCRLRLPRPARSLQRRLALAGPVPRPVPPRGVGKPRGPLERRFVAVAAELRRVRSSHEFGGEPSQARPRLGPRREMKDGARHLAFLVDQVRPHDGVGRDVRQVLEIPR